MSKQSEEKLNQGYNEKPIPRTCANCAKYQSEFVDLSPPYPGFCVKGPVLQGGEDVKK